MNTVHIDTRKVIKQVLTTQESVADMLPEIMFFLDRAGLSTAGRRRRTYISGRVKDILEQHARNVRQYDGTFNDYGYEIVVSHIMTVAGKLEYRLHCARPAYQEDFICNG